VNRLAKIASENEMRAQAENPDAATGSFHNAPVNAVSSRWWRDQRNPAIPKAGNGNYQGL
jgi:hypothetical protein